MLHFLSVCNCAGDSDSLLGANCHDSAKPEGNLSQVLSLGEELSSNHSGEKSSTGAHPCSSGDLFKWSFVRTDAIHPNTGF